MTSVGMTMRQRTAYMLLLGSVKLMPYAVEKNRHGRVVAIKNHFLCLIYELLATTALTLDP